MRLSHKGSVTELLRRIAHLDATPYHSSVFIAFFATHMKLYCRAKGRSRIPSFFGHFDVILVEVLRASAEDADVPSGDDGPLCSGMDKYGPTMLQHVRITYSVAKSAKSFA